MATVGGEMIAHKSRKTVKNKGMPLYQNAMCYGNLYIEFDVEFPKKNSLNP